MSELMRYLGYSVDNVKLYLTITGWSLVLTGFIISTILLVYVLKRKSISKAKFSQLYLEMIAIITICCGGYSLYKNSQIKDVMFYDKFELVGVRNNVAIYKNKETNKPLEITFKEIEDENSIISVKGSNKDFKVKNKDFVRELSVINSPM
jgi:hypothetical protein